MLFVCMYHFSNVHFAVSEILTNQLIDLVFPHADIELLVARLLFENLDLFLCADLARALSVSSSNICFV